MKKPFVLLTTAVSALAVAAVVGVGVAAADPTPGSTPSSTSSASPAPSASPTTTPGKPGQASPKKHRDLTQRALHGEVTLGGEKHRVVAFQRGTVSAVDAGSLTVRSEDGFAGTYVVGPKTEVRLAKKAAAIADVAVGDHVRVRAVEDGQTLTASRVAGRKG